MLSALPPGHLPGQVSKLLGDAGPGREWSAEEVTRAIYSDEAGVLTIPERLVGPAIGVTNLVLKKLQDDGELVAKGDKSAAVWKPKL